MGCWFIRSRFLSYTLSHHLPPPSPSPISFPSSPISSPPLSPPPSLHIPCMYCIIHLDVTDSLGHWLIGLQKEGGCEIVKERRRKGEGRIERAGWKERERDRDWPTPATSVQSQCSKHMRTAPCNGWCPAPLHFNWNVSRHFKEMCISFERHATSHHLREVFLFIYKII